MAPAPNINSDDYYEVLGVSKSADDKAIKKAYRKLAVKHHPDKNPDDKENAEERFKKITEAYSVLSDKEKKKVYDQFGKAGLDPSYGGGGASSSSGFPGGFPGGGVRFTTSSNMSFSDANDIFKTFFGGEDPFSMFNGGVGGGGMGMNMGMNMGMGGGFPGGGVAFNMGGGGAFPGFPGMMGGGFPGANRFKRQRSSSDPGVYTPGTNIIIKGLRSAQHHNSKVAVVESYVPSKDRYQVQVQGGGTIALRPANMQQVVDCVVEGLKGSTDLNGSKGKIVGFDDKADRYHVNVDGEIVALKRANARLEKRTVVRIQGLAKAAHLNGKYGTIKSYDRSAGRYVVEMRAGEVLKIRASNVKA